MYKQELEKQYEELCRGVQRMLNTEDHKKLYRIYTYCETVLREMYNKKAIEIASLRK